VNILVISPQIWRLASHRKLSTPRCAFFQRKILPLLAVSAADPFYHRCETLIRFSEMLAKSGLQADTFPSPLAVVVFSVLSALGKFAVQIFFSPPFGSAISVGPLTSHCKPPPPSLSTFSIRLWPFLSHHIFFPILLILAAGLESDTHKMLRPRQPLGFNRTTELFFSVSGRQGGAKIRRKPFPRGASRDPSVVRAAPKVFPFFAKADAPPFDR